MAGYKQGVSYLRGYVLSTPLDDNAPVGLDNIPVVATFHRSYIRQGKPQVFSVLVHDLQQAVLIARSGRPSALPTRHIPQPTESGRRDFLTRLRDSPLLPWLTYDIETPNSADLDGRARRRHLLRHRADSVLARPRRRHRPVRVAGRPRLRSAGRQDRARPQRQNGWTLRPPVRRPAPARKWIRPPGRDLGHLRNVASLAA